MLFAIAVALVLLLIPLFTLRLLQILPSKRTRPARKRLKETSVHLLVVLGSGGHTAEMFALLRTLDPEKYNRRTYIVSSGDNFSAGKAHDFEKDLSTRVSESGLYAVKTVPRARRIHQGLWTTPFSSLYCLSSCMVLLHNGGYPDIILCNGPATSVILVLASLLLRFLGLCRGRAQVRTIYVESWARVRKLSLSGRLLLPVVDRFIVQWRVLADIVGGRAEYLGVLV